MKDVIRIPYSRNKVEFETILRAKYDFNKNVQRHGAPPAEVWVSNRLSKGYVAQISTPVGQVFLISADVLLDCMRLTFDHMYAVTMGREGEPDSLVGMPIKRIP